MLEGKKLVGVGCGVLSEISKRSEGSLSQGRSFSKSGSRADGNCAEQALVLLCVPGRVVTVGFPRYARDRRKISRRTWSPAEPQLFRRNSLRAAARTNAQVAHLGQKAGTLH